MSIFKAEVVADVSFVDVSFLPGEGNLNVPEDLGFLPESALLFDQQQSIRRGHLA